MDDVSVQGNNVRPLSALSQMVIRFVNFPAEKDNVRAVLLHKKQIFVEIRRNSQMKDCSYQ